MAIAAFPFWSQVLGTIPFDAAGAAAAAQSASQPLDSDLTAIAALTTAAYGRSLLTLANQAALYTALGTGPQDNTHYLRGDGTWATVAGGGGGATLAANSFTDTQTITPPTGTHYGLSVVLPPGNINNGTLDSQGYRITFPAGVNNGGVFCPPVTMITTESSDQFGGVDNVFQLGHNNGPTGRIDPTFPSLVISMEGIWRGQMEYHVFGEWVGGISTRAWSVVFPNATKEPTHYWTGTIFNFLTRTDNGAGRLPFFAATNPNTFSTLLLASYNGGLTAQYTLTFSQATLNNTTISQTGTTAASGLIDINATKSVSINQAGIVVDVTQLSGAGQTTFNFDMKSGSNAIGYQSNFVIKNSNNLLMNQDGAIRWDAGGAGTWLGGQLIQFSGGNLWLQNKSPTGEFRIGNSSASNTAGVIVVQNKGVDVLQVNTNNTVSLVGTLTAGGLTTTALQVATSGPLIYSGSGAPTISAAVKGSLYLRSDGTTTNDRIYVAKDTAGTWASLTSAS